jgi:hypothetical protein
LDGGQHIAGQWTTNESEPYKPQHGEQWLREKLPLLRQIIPAGEKTHIQKQQRCKSALIRNGKKSERTAFPNPQKLFIGGYGQS